MTRTHWRVATLVALLVLAPVAGLTAGVGAAAQAQPADLAIDQPHYIEESVRTTTVNGTTAYVVQGPQVEIRPQNFRAENVVDYGVDTEVGQLRGGEGGEYTLDAEGQTGTFELYWVVTRQQTVEVAVNNSSATETVVQNVTTRYEATVRFADKTAMSHLQSGAIETIREKANKYDEIHGTYESIKKDGLLLWMGNPPTFEQFIQGAVNTYVSTRDPIQGLLTGSGVILVLFTTMFGLLLVGADLLFFFWRDRSLRQELHEYRATESAEGELKENLLEIDLREKLQAFANYDHNDWFPDFVAHAMREGYGETPEVAYETVSKGDLLPETWVKDRLLAADAAGYRVAVPDGEGGGELAADGAGMRLVKPTGDIHEYETALDIGANIDDVVDTLDWSDPALVAFNPAEADIDRGEYEVEPAVHTMDGLQSTFDEQWARFESKETAGQVLHEFFENVEEHARYTDENGVPDDARAALSTLLRFLRKSEDEAGVPWARYQRQAVECALVHHDRSAEAKQTLEDYREGR